MGDCFQVTKVKREVLQMYQVHSDGGSDETPVGGMMMMGPVRTEFFSVGCQFLPQEKEFLYVWVSLMRNVPFQGVKTGLLTVPDQAEKYPSNPTEGAGETEEHQRALVPFAQ